MSAPISHAWETFSFSDNSLNGGLSVQKVSLLFYTMQFLFVNNVCDIYSPHSSYFCSPEVQVLFRNEITYRCLHVHLFIEQYYRLLVGECTICYMFLFFHFPYLYATSDYDNVFAIFRTQHRIISLWHAIIERYNKIKFYVVYNTYLYIDAVWLLLIIK